MEKIIKKRRGKKFVQNKKKSSQKKSKKAKIFKKIKQKNKSEENFGKKNWEINWLFFVNFRSSIPKINYGKKSTKNPQLKKNEKRFWPNAQSYQIGLTKRRLLKRQWKFWREN